MARLEAEDAAVEAKLEGVRAAAHRMGGYTHAELHDLRHVKGQFDDVVLVLQRGEGSRAGCAPDAAAHITAPAARAT